MINNHFCSSFEKVFFIFLYCSLSFLIPSIASATEAETEFPSLSDLNVNLKGMDGYTKVDQTYYPELSHYLQRTIGNKNMILEVLVSKTDDNLIRSEAFPQGLNDYIIIFKSKNELLASTANITIADFRLQLNPVNNSKAMALLTAESGNNKLGFTDRSNIHLKSMYFDRVIVDTSDRISFLFFIEIADANNHSRLMASGISVFQVQDSIIFMCVYKRVAGKDPEEIEQLKMQMAKSIEDTVLAAKFEAKE